MGDPLAIIILVFTAGLTFGASILTIKGHGLIRIGGLNFARLKELNRLKERTDDPARKMALEAVIQHCQALRAKWILQEADLKVGEHTQQLVESIAGIFHPRSSAPLAEARLGNLLGAFLELKNRILFLAQQKGVRGVTQFRLRHVAALSRAWKKKEEWQRSVWGRFFARYRLAALLRWIYYVVRFMDLTFWTFKMLGYIFHDVVLKVLLIRWYLIVGELTIGVYADRAPEPEIAADDLLRQLGSIPEQEMAPDLPAGVRKIADASRKTLLFHTRALEWNQALAIYQALVRDISRHYYPDAENPLYEARLYNLMLGVSRLSEEVASIRTKPVMNKLLDIRLCHLLLARDAADYLRDSEFFSWLNKYPVHRYMKLSHLLYQTLSKKHPGILFKDFAFFLVKESGKRWVYVYLHNRIAGEANHVFGESRS